MKSFVAIVQNNAHESDRWSSSFVSNNVLMTWSCRFCSTTNAPRCYHEYFSGERVSYLVRCHVSDSRFAAPRIRRLIFGGRKTSETQTVGGQSRRSKYTLLCFFLLVLADSFHANKALQRPLQSFHTVMITFMMDPLTFCLRTNYFLWVESLRWEKYFFQKWPRVQNPLFQCRAVSPKELSTTNKQQKKNLHLQ